MKTKDIFESTFGQYLNFLSTLTKEFTLIGVLSMYLYLKSFDVSTFEVQEEDIKK